MSENLWNITSNEPNRLCADVLGGNLVVKTNPDEIRLTWERLLDKKSSTSLLEVVALSHVRGAVRAYGEKYLPNNQWGESETVEVVPVNLDNILNDPDYSALIEEIARGHQSFKRLLGIYHQGTFEAIGDVVPYE